MTQNDELSRVRAIVEPIAADLDLDVYDIERRGATVRITLDTPPGSDGGITLDNLSLATRLISREIDHEDPISTRFTLEVTSPGLERQLRTPSHFQREVGKDVTVRFRDADADPRRIDGRLTAATETAATLLRADGTETTFDYSAVDKARTVFEWGPKPKPGGSKQAGPKQAGSKQGAGRSGAPPASDQQSDSTNPESNKEKQTS